MRSAAQNMYSQAIVQPCGEDSLQNLAQVLIANMFATALMPTLPVIAVKNAMRGGDKNSGLQADVGRRPPAAQAKAIRF
jgi:hypothetical protein